MTKNERPPIFASIHSGSGIPRNPRYPPRNSTDAIAARTTMPAYSDNRKNANFRPVYSVSAPKMISESATGMSNGGRDSSATAAIMNTMNSGNSGIAYQIVRWDSTMPIIDVVPASMTTAAPASTSGSSYAISWAAARNAPINENLFAEDQPAISTPSTPTDVM